MSIRQHTPAASTAPDRLTLIEHARQAVFQSDGMAAAARLEPWIERSWRRCLAQGLQPDQRLAFDPVSSVAMRRVIEANQPLLRAAAPVIQQLARAMADTRYFAILTDA
ncbi:MAG: histidine kinase, partial [Hydrogenophaga sp.]|nr:histidine kinase [Hydrogenophaga sp.]